MCHNEGVAEGDVREREREREGSRAELTCLEDKNGVAHIRELEGIGRTVALHQHLLRREDEALARDDAYNNGRGSGDGLGGELASQMRLDRVREGARWKLGRPASLQLEELEPLRSELALERYGRRAVAAHKELILEPPGAGALLGRGVHGADKVVPAEEDWGGDRS